VRKTKYSSSSQNLQMNVIGHSGLVTVLEVEKNKKNNQNEKKNNQKITLSKPKYC